MLVLSRRSNETIKFPELGITIEVLKVKGSTVRVGVDAPIEIKVKRGELDSPDDANVAKKIVVDAQEAHEIRNVLNTLTIAAGLTKKLLSQGKTNLAAETLHKALADIADCQTETPQTLSKVLDATGPRALLIEDAANEREMLAGFLRLHGYTVDTVSDGIEAMEFLADNEKPDFMLVDMNMPRLDGPGVIKMIRSNAAFDDIEIFAVSGQTAKGAGVDVHENRVADWFQKPLKPAGLVAAINRHVLQPRNETHAANSN